MGYYYHRHRSFPGFSRPAANLDEIEEEQLGAKNNMNRTEEFGQLKGKAPESRLTAEKIGQQKE